MPFKRDLFYQEVGLRLRRLREASNATQEEVAAVVGITRASYASIETGRQAINLDLAWKLAVHFGVSLERLVPEPVGRRRSTDTGAARGTAAEPFRIRPPAPKDTALPN